MLRSPALLLLLAASACRQEQTPETPLAPAVVAVSGADTLAIEQAVLEFLEGYAEADVSAERLASHVAGPDLEDWVHWLEVQYEGVEEEVAAELDLTAFRATHVQDRVAAAGVEASVTIAAPGKDGSTVRTPRRFQSPFLLVRGEAPLEWRVVDAVRDGRSMRDAISLLEGVAAAANGLAVEVVSVYRFTGATAVNVRIANETRRPLTIDGPHSILQVGGRFLGSTQLTPTIAGPIAPGKTVEGALNFPPMPLTSAPERLMLFLQGMENAAVTVDLPFDAFPPQES